MSVSSTSAAAQVERALTEVEKAERRVADLEAEKKGLQAEKNDLEELAHAVVKARHERTSLTDDIKDRLDAVVFFVDLDRLEDVLADLKKKLTSVKERLTSVKKRLTSVKKRLTSANKQVELALEIQWYVQAEQTRVDTQRNERLEILSMKVAALTNGTPTKRAAPGDFVTSPSKMSRVGVGGGDGTPRTPTGGPLTWKLSFRVTDGARVPRLRNWLYTAAMETVGYEHEIGYTRKNGVITASSSLEGFIFYETKDSARAMETRLRAECFKQGLTVDTKVAREAHECVHRLWNTLYNAVDSHPNCGEWQDVQVIESVSDIERDSWTSRLTAQEIREESPLVYATYDPQQYCQKAEWTHIKESADCNDDEAEDRNNRLILPALFHMPYGETGVPNLSFVYLGDAPPQGKSDITLHVVFATPAMAKDLAGFLKDPVSCGDRTYTCTLTHPDPPRFVAYLNERHNANQARNPVLTPAERSDALIASQATSDF